MNQLSAIMSGFSIVSAAVLLFAYLFFLDEMQKTRLSKIACCAVLLGLAGVQLYHFRYFFNGDAALDQRVYVMLLTLVPVFFFFFSREVLFFGETARAKDAIHLVPIIIALVIPIRFVPPLAFAIGAIYTYFFARKVLVLRPQTKRFRFEVFFFVLFFVMATIALVLGLSLPLLDHALFYHAYANCIALAMLLVMAAFLVFPELLSDIALITETTYAKSRLDNVDVDAKMRALERLMTEDHHYQNEDLKLGDLAQLLDLTAHQLSEAINSHYGFGFPRFIREHRVRAAAALLVAEPTASVLSVGLATGFKSQSTFYSAFKEIKDVSPGQYRKNHMSSPR